MKKELLKQGHKTIQKFAMLTLLTALAALVLLSCGRNEDDTESTSTLRELTFSNQSQFLKELEIESYRDAEALETPPVFQWNFSKKQIYSYTYEQKVRNKTNMDAFSKTSQDTEQTMTGKGELLIKSQGDHTANLVLKDMKMKMEMNLSEEGGPKTMEQTAPQMVIQGMKEDGSLSLCNSSQEMLLRMLFPLPSKGLKVGESVDVPAYMPFNAMGSLLQVKGRSRITLTKYVKIGGHTCAQFDTDIDISELNLPSELKGDYSCSEKGASRFYFDIAKRRFISGSIAIMMQFSIDAPMPQMRVGGEKTPDMPKRAQMSMVSDNLIRVAIKE